MHRNGQKHGNRNLRGVTNKTRVPSGAAFTVLNGTHVNKAVVTPTLQPPQNASAIHQS